MDERNNIFRGKKVMITGGTGSFGSTFLNFLQNTEASEIRVFSRDELKQEILRVNNFGSRVNFFIGDVRDFSSIESATRGIDYLFHAAALKQVPSCEFNPMQAIQTNILGAENVLEAAARNQVKKVVVLSTDKAVYPINTMGMTKAIMEKLAISKSRDSRFLAIGGVACATRYGNVMCSRGSIIPLFIEQIQQGLPLTLTDPKMTRFMMSLDDSVTLVMKAFQDAEAGDIFVQKAPASTIETLAVALKELFNASNPIKIIGPRHGEKLYETLCGSEEMAKASDLGDYYRIPADMRDLNYGNYIDAPAKSLTVSEYNSQNTYQLTLQELKDLLLTLPYVREKLGLQ